MLMTVETRLVYAQTLLQSCQNLQRLMKLNKTRKMSVYATSTRIWYYSLQVEADRRKDVLVRRQPLRDHVGVVDDVPAEDQAAANGEDQVHGAAERHEDADKAGHNCEGKVRQLTTMHQGCAYGERTGQRTTRIPSRRSRTTPQLVTSPRHISNALTLDCIVNRVRPRKTPTVISLKAMVSRFNIAPLRSDSQSLKHDRSVEEGCHDTKGECLKEREGRQ